jgi:Glycosyl hydrolase 36 superfamily, catalytic domain
VIERRALLRLMVLGGTAAVTPAWAIGFGRPTASERDRRVSLYGGWVTRAGLPAFAYDGDQDALPDAEWDPTIGPRTRRHWVMLGNEAIRIQAANDGTLALFDEGDGLRWLTAPDPAGTGVSILHDGDTVWGTDYGQRAGGAPPLRTFGPAWFQVRDARAGLTLERTVFCPEGAVPWVLVRVQLSLAGGTPSRAVRHVERWALRPRFLNLLETAEQRRTRAELAVAYDVTPSAAGGLVAAERFAAPDAGGAVGEAAGFLIGPPATLVLEPVGRTTGDARAVFDGSPHPTLEIETPLVMKPGTRRELWFRFGRPATDTISRPARLVTASLRGLKARLPQAAAPSAPEVRHEIPWHTALLTGGLAVDRVIGGHTLDQASAYSYSIGFNGAARDPLQHALPLVYIAPALALSVLRNTCAWATPDGDLPYALDPAKRPTNLLFRPSDQNLWALWLAAEYAAATGDLAAFDEPAPYHPARATPPVPLREHLRRQFRFFVDGVGRGEGRHVRILNADWNDVAIAESGADRDVMIERGGSVLNSAMAAWVLPVFAGLAERLGDTALATEARVQADDLRGLVTQAWNGRWFHRAYAPGVGPIGDTQCWLEVQPWAILCGAADASQATSLLATIDAGHRAGSPLGARLRWPATEEELAAGRWGEGTAGGIWYSINMTLVWAAARVAPAMAWDEWRRMTLAAHTAAHPGIWEGTLSGPDAWNAPESRRPGRTWAAPPLSMQAFPVNNMHSHAQPLLAYLRLLGVEPTPSGSLTVGGGGRFRSEVFRVEQTGHGLLRARGPVVVESPRKTVRGGGAGTVRW